MWCIIRKWKRKPGLSQGKGSFGGSGGLVLFLSIFVYLLCCTITKCAACILDRGQRRPAAEGFDAIDSVVYYCQLSFLSLIEKRELKKYRLFFIVCSCNLVGVHGHHWSSLFTDLINLTVILDFFWWWLRQKGPGPSPRRRYQQQQQKPHHRKNRSIGSSNNNNNEESSNMLGAAQDQIAPIRLSGHTLDKATKAKVSMDALNIFLLQSLIFYVCA